MKILVIGNGGREHAICRALRTGADKPDLFIAPGNPGTAELGRNVAIAVTDVTALTAFAQHEGIDLVIPGPEAALCAGIADALAKVGIPCCGPTQAAAQLEASKVFTRELAARLHLPSPMFARAHDDASLRAALARFGNAPPVLKADGLASGKGVFLPDTFDDCLRIGQALLAGSLGTAGASLVLEERLQGPEASLFFACSGIDAVALPHARDHKRLQDGDRGPNTGGMGAISPNPGIHPALEASVRATMVLPTLRALQDAGTPFCGFLFLGLMLTDDGPKLLEYNVRLGDPEAQAVLPRLADGELLRLCRATAAGALAGFTLAQDDRATCAIVLAAAGYPDTPRHGDALCVGPELVQDDRWLVHAGTEDDAGILRTSGGRIAAVVARAATPELARQRAYEGVAHVQFDGMQWRRDVGTYETKDLV